MTTFASRCLLKPGPSAEKPITFVAENATADEDGARARVEFDFTLEEFEQFLRDGGQAAQWVKSGAWKPGGGR